jgi:RNA polymerase sigma-70 factor (ECF subfamily)
MVPPPSSGAKASHFWVEHLGEDSPEIFLSGHRTGAAGSPSPNGMQNTIVLDALQQRRELTGYCTRILGSAFEADDAVQETMVRAWRRQDSFEGRSSVHSWLYRIATNVCLDMLRSRGRRAVPTDLDSLEVLPHGQDLQAEDPADTVAAREQVQQAFVVALQALPARQRSVLILRDVLRWSSPEVAELLGTTPASVNSALQRARATLAARRAAGEVVVPSPLVLDDEQRGLLAGLVAAFERHDVTSLVGRLTDSGAA